jgi:hypothetical protein
MPKWTNVEAEAMVAKLGQVATANELSLTIAGVVAMKGFSDNDLDLRVDGIADGNLDMFLEEIESQFGISHETISTPGGPDVRLFVNNDQQIDLFDSGKPATKAKAKPRESMCLLSLKHWLKDEKAIRWSCMPGSIPESGLTPPDPDFPYAHVKAVPSADGYKVEFQWYSCEELFERKGQKTVKEMSASNFETFRNLWKPIDCQSNMSL